MQLGESHSANIAQKGYTVIENIFSEKEIIAIANAIDNADTNRDTFRSTDDLFAIRQFLKEFPDLKQIIFNDNLRKVVQQLFGDNYFVVKSIYFDKPQKSNWYVARHQDLTISVKEKHDVEGYDTWTKKQGQYAVQPPVEVLENIYTIRIHLDDTNEGNGALKVIPGSHAKEIYRPETIDWDKETEESCNVGKGGIMIMKPLLMHSSSRTVNNSRRRVIHIEFSSVILPTPLQWAEQMIF